MTPLFVLLAITVKITWPTYQFSGQWTKLPISIRAPQALTRVPATHRRARPSRIRLWRLLLVTNPRGTDAQMEDEEGGGSGDAAVVTPTVAVTPTQCAATGATPILQAATDATLAWRAAAAATPPPACCDSNDPDPTCSSSGCAPYPTCCGSGRAPHQARCSGSPRHWCTARLAPSLVSAPCLRMSLHLQVL
jgi:hypothetical protein